jgi:OmpA-OmpF porin, OOP family
MYYSIKLIHIVLLSLIVQLAIFNNSYANFICKKKEVREISGKGATLKKIKRTAQYYERIENYDEAIKQYKLYLNKKPSDEKVIQRLSMLNYQERNYELACIYFEKLIKVPSKKYKDEQLYYAKSLMVQKRYKEALDILAYLKRDPRGFSDRNSQFLVKNYIKACETNLEVKKEEYIEVISINPVDALNTPYHDVNARLIDENTLLYTSYFFPDSNTNRIFEEKDNPHRSLIIAKKEKDIWGNSTALDWPLNEKNTDTENGVYNAGNTRFYFTRSRKNWKGKTISEIYACDKEDDEWGFPEKLPYPINDENFTNSQPAIGIDIRTQKEIIYFISDRTRGQGGLDIWYSEYNSSTNTYSEPRNAGRQINTAGNEITPFCNNENNELYFSSDGLPGFGGYDIFKTRGNESNWIKPIQLKYPINSSFDDIYLSTSLEDNNKGFFSSNRPAGYQPDSTACSYCEDIYSYTIEKTSVNFIKGIVLNETDIDFYDILTSKMKLETQLKKDNDPISGVSVLLYEKDDENKGILIAQKETDSKGEYLFKSDPGKDYEIVVKNLGHFDKKERFSTKRITQQDTLFIKDIYINYIEPDLKLSANILFEFGKAKLSKEGCNYIDTTLFPVLNLMPNAIVEIGAHTDSIGTAEYNFHLSDKRAEVIMRYLIAKGISKDRIVSRGYGESFPIAPNSFPDGSDNPEGREANRRTEIKIIGSLKM